MRHLTMDTNLKYVQYRSLKIFNLACSRLTDAIQYKSISVSGANQELPRSMIQFCAYVLFVSMYKFNTSILVREEARSLENYHSTEILIPIVHEMHFISHIYQTVRTHYQNVIQYIDTNMC